MFCNIRRPPPCSQYNKHGREMLRDYGSFTSVITTPQANPLSCPAPPGLKVFLCLRSIGGVYLSKQRGVNSTADRAEHYTYVSPGIMLRILYALAKQVVLCLSVCKIFDL